jgi:hypothetical protein
MVCYEKVLAMKKSDKIFILLAIIFLCMIVTGFAQMASENFQIQNSVQSGGGRDVASENYQISSTLGQSSPLPDPAGPPFSDTYDLYPGFWCVIAAFESTCPGDFNGDTDVDGSDLAEYIFDSEGLDLEVFAVNFGRADCP